jgi:putative PIN family toxin of toxin-antitoxin system
MKPSVVLDTNILLDLFYFSDPSVADLHQALFEGRIHAYTLEVIWEEFEEVLGRKPFHQSAKAIAQIREKNETLFIWQELGSSTCGIRCRDQDDQVFLELAVQNAPCLLITKDTDLLKLKKRLLPFQVQILQKFPN